ncbi:YceI family protein [Pseudothauera rhizosphaerae]|uniref:YceI family protein n=1 Tax=Pseudothauera rhizosphaerae TaxID=2565932 RepID=A0A4S4A9Y3_9RHOO|nr:YceI family protein [Pseudothauera rhizosphaerae]THF55386.1 YceI family protein [Pseudothauera rhizosphaerae]
MTRSLSVLLASLSLATFAGSAVAANYGQVLAERSAVSFVSKQMGVEVGGSFGKFDASLQFDPASPEQGRARLEIELASIDAGSKDANDEVVGKAWFNVKEHPRATFESTAVKALGGNRFEVTGQLTIKGRTRPATAPFTFREDGGNGVFEGEFTLKRLDFAIGEGMWSDVGVVADEVKVRFNVVAAAAR